VEGEDKKEFTMRALKKRAALAPDEGQDASWERLS